MIYVGHFLTSHPIALLAAISLIEPAGVTAPIALGAIVTVSCLSPEVAQTEMVQ